jgi:hypothetical protein
MGSVSDGMKKSSASATAAWLDFVGRGREQGVNLLRRNLVGGRLLRPRILRELNGRMEKERA